MDKKGFIITCVSCEKEFYVPAYRKKTAKFCSLYCQNHRQYEHMVRICLKCGKEFMASISRGKKKYCSEECWQNSFTSAKERRLKQKSAQILKRGRNSSRDIKKHLERSCIELKCSRCGYDEHSFCIDVHHKDGDPNNNKLANLELYCAICHRIVHYGNKKKKSKHNSMKKY